jgi:REP element-mobilizing transposase RayT
VNEPIDFNRQSNRWQEHDYAAGGTFFVTIVTFNRTCLFGDVHEGGMCLNAVGRIVDAEWMRSGIVRPEVDIDVFCVMPNHLHGLVTIKPSETPVLDRNRAVGYRAHNGVPLRAKRSLSSIVAQFKASSTRRINDLRGTPNTKIWQRGFHDRVVRNDDEYMRIADYIVTNPERWEQDDHFPWGNP